ncbi:MAG: hypothetical protein LC804_09630, partial [Acidobacteria bacterium]|nr:hypothetical protein [Acidobacteriota bacterium]
MIRDTLSRIWWRRFVSRNARPWHELREFERRSPDEQRKDLAARLAAQVRYFGGRADALPEWCDAARLSPDDLWRQWSSLPVVTKEMLQSRFVPGDIQQRFGVAGTIKTTGGSTGEPTAVLHDPFTVRTHNATSAYAQLQMGWRPGMPIVKLWGSERDIGKSRRRYDRASDYLLRTTLVDGYRLTDATVDRFLEAVQSPTPVAVGGFTSMLEFVARRTLERGQTPPVGRVHTAWNGGEMLLPEQIDVFQRAFGVPILNLYGGRELSVMAFQRTAGEPLELPRPWLFLEVVDLQGRPAQPGEPGKLLWTSTVCRGTPFLRYEVGDLGAFSAPDQTESGLTRLRELHGRTAGLLQLQDGRMIQNIFWNHFFKDVPEARQFQVTLKRSGDIDVLLVGSGFTPDREAQVRSTLAGFLGDTRVHLTWTDGIPLTAQGKLIQVRREQGAA